MLILRIFLGLTWGLSGLVFILASIFMAIDGSFSRLFPDIKEMFERFEEKNKLICYCACIFAVSALISFWVSILAAILLVGK